MKWFQVDSNAPNDPRIRAVQLRHGVEGIGATFLLWCFVANHGARAGWSVDHRDQPIAKPFLIDASGIEESKFDRLIATLIEVGHVSDRAWNDHGVLAFPAMERRADIYTKRQQKAAKANHVRSRFAPSAKNVGVQTNSTNKQTVHTKRRSS
jgi:hypothetical protein